MVIQFALALVLVANLSMDRDARSQGTGIAIDPKPLLTAQLAFPPTTYESAEDRRRLLDQLAENFGRAEGVSAMTVATQLPPEAGVPMRILRPDQTLAAGEQGETVFAASVGARYFETLGVSLIAGRDLSTDDDVQGREGVVINEHLADRLWICLL